MSIDFGDFDKDRCEGLKTGSFTSKMSCDIPGCGSQKRYKTVILDLKLCISGNKTWHLFSVQSLCIE